jgi:nicotinamidase/pyrazinamidase
MRPCLHEQSISARPLAVDESGLSADNGFTVHRVNRAATMALNLIFWEVDCQRDFLLPAGKLYVPGAEKILPNLRKLTDAARNGHFLLISHGCYHPENDPEFATFPPHCIKGTPGSQLVPEAFTEKVFTIPNESSATVPDDFRKYDQIHLEKQTLDIFETRHAEEVLKWLPRDAEFVVFGVVTEYCVRLAAKGLLDRGRRVFVVKDAIETLNAADGERTIAELQALGASFISTDQALGLAAAA